MIGTQDELVALAKGTAIHYSLDASTICGIVAREGAWNPWTIRYEPDFFTRYIGPLYLAHKVDLTEAHGRALSWGLMQVMGEVAREIGFSGSLPQLL